MTKTQKQAKIAKNQGYEYITSIVKNVYTTNYYHCNHVDSVIKNGWIGSPCGINGSRIGALAKDLPAGKTISRVKMMSLKSQTKTQKQAEIAKNQGYEYITTLVKTVFATNYYHYNHVDSVIEDGWIGSMCNPKWCGRRIGVLAKDLPAGKKLTLKQMLKLTDEE